MHREPPAPSAPEWLTDLEAIPGKQRLHAHQIGAPWSVPNAATVESRTGAVAWAMRQRSVSRPRSSNRTCGFPASGFPTGFTARHTAARRVRSVLPKQWAMADAPSSTDRRPSSPRGKASSEASGYSGVFQAHRQSPILGSLQSAPEARALSSASITRPPRSYGPLRLPSDPPPVRRRGCPPRSRRVSPDDPHHPSNVPCPVPRRIETGACVDCFPAHAAFPVSQAGRHPHLHFRGLLRLHARYGPLDCSTAQGGLRHEAPAQSVARPNRSSATGAIDNSPGGTLLHW